MSNSDPSSSTVRAAATSLDWERLKSRSASVPAHVVFRAFVSETVLLNIETGKYYALDEVGGHFYEVMCRSPSLDVAVEALLTEFDASEDRIREDLVRYCGELLPRGLIELR